MSDIQTWDVLRWSYVGENAPTSFDVLSIGDLDDAELEKFLRDNLWSDWEWEICFEKFNRIFQKVINYLGDELFYTKPELQRFKRRKISDINALKNFLRETQEKKGKMNCVIAKVFQAFFDSDEEFNKRVKEVKDKTQWVIDGKLLKPLRILQSNDDEYIWEEYYEFGLWKIKKIPYRLKKRVKSTHSAVSKEIRDPKYFTIEKTSDLHGLTFEIESREDILPLMQRVAWYVFKNGVYEVKNDKGMFSIDEIEKNPDIDEDFKARAAVWTQERDKPESGDVVDIKLISPKDKNNATRNMNIEIKFTVVKNRNENGLNMHGIYNYMKKISERIRLEGFVSYNYVSLIAEKFVEKIPSLLVENVWRPEEEWGSSYPYKKELFSALKNGNFLEPDAWVSVANFDLRNNHIKSHIDEYLHKWITQYFLSKLTPVYINGGKKIYYTNSRALKMSESWLGARMERVQL